MAYLMNKLLPILAFGAIFLSGCQPTTVKPTKNTPVVALPAPLPAPAPPIAAVEEPLSAEVTVLREGFIVETAKKYQIPEATIRDVLAKAKYKQSIVNAMSRPAEATKTWAQYRPIFVTSNRISQGQSYLTQNRVELDRIANQYGVPSEIILAIMGVETGWGQNMGSHNVLDALYTFAFYYPIING